MNAYGCQSMVRPLKRVLVKRPEEAFESQERIDAQWQSLDYLVRPDFSRAVDEHRRFTALLEAADAEVACLPADGRTGLDALYTHDPVASVTDQGVILGRMGKDARMEEPDALADWFTGAGIPVAGRIEPPGSIEGGDVVWLKDDLAVIGLTYRTNGEGIRQFQALLNPRGIDVVAVPMVHWDGPGAVLHLMSVISLLDTDLAVVYERLLPIPFREMLAALGIALVVVPDEEYDSLGCNVLAV
ncbi:MAG: amidinotransferase, partial [Gemmatimonadetes bacterium]|nr:amidinotransferase [Gemmatimonadota bacterium]